LLCATSVSTVQEDPTEDSLGFPAHPLHFLSPSMMDSPASPDLHIPAHPPFVLTPVTKSNRFFLQTGSDRNVLFPQTFPSFAGNRSREISPKWQTISILGSSLISQFFKPFKRLVAKSTEIDPHLSKYPGHNPTPAHQFKHLRNMNSRFQKEKMVTGFSLCPPKISVRSHLLACAIRFLSDLLNSG
jgi:hypothetical protein